MTFLDRVRNPSYNSDCDAVHNRNQTPGSLAARPETGREGSKRKCLYPECHGSYAGQRFF